MDLALTMATRFITTLFYGDNMKPEYDKVPIATFRRMLARKAKVTIPTAMRVMDTFWDLIHDAVVAQKRICIPGVGEFYALPTSGGRVLIGPDGEPFYSKPTYKLYFASSKIWRNKIKKEMGEPEDY